MTAEIYIDGELVVTTEGLGMVPKVGASILVPVSEGGDSQGFLSVKVEKVDRTVIADRPVLTVRAVTG